MVNNENEPRIQSRQSRTDARRGLLGGAVLSSALPRTVAGAATAEPHEGLADLIARLFPSVVAIRTVVNSPGGQLAISGSGFIVSSSGVIATNRHIIAGGTKFSVTLVGRDPLPATVIYVAE
jgi:S1-C subfamily serine protease